jgi:hypothetical protein
MQNKANFKKVEIGVSSLTTIYYTDLGGFGQGKNKANSNPIRAF